MEAILLKADVEALLPQKAPFVMADALYNYTETQIVAGLTVTENNILTENGIFTESGLLEHMAQCIALHAGYRYKLKNEPVPMGFIAAMNNTEIYGLPKTGDAITTTATLLREFGGMSQVKVVSAVNGNTIAEGEMKTVIAQGL